MAVTFTNSQKTATTTDQTAVASNSLRRYLLIQNNGDENIRIAFGTAATTSTGIRLAPAEAYEPRTVPYQDVHVIAEANTSTVDIVEGE